jgi:hypothetical protein
LQTNVNLKNKSIINFNLNFIKMKKGLLSLLAVALTIVSCQDYDDQFAELTGLVNDLSTEVEGLTQVQTQLSALSTTVSGLATAITNDSTGLASLAADLEAAQTAIDAITAALADVSSAADLALIDDAIVALQEDVDTLLEADAVINQPVTINNAATLKYVSTLIASGEDDPKVIVNGDVVINLTAITDAASITLANNIAGKLGTVIGDVTVTSAASLNLSALSFIDGDYSVSGSDANDGSLATISGGLTTNYAGAHNYAHLASVGAVVITNSVSATSLVFGDNTTVASIDDATTSLGVLVLPNATVISLGTAPVSDLTANKATSVELKAVAAATGLSIEATSAASITVNYLETAGGALSITGTGTTILHVDALTTAGAITAVADEAHFGKLTSASGLINVTAKTAANFAALTAIDADANIGGATVILTALAATSTGTLTLPDAIEVNAAALVNGASLTAPKATSVTIKSSSVANLTVVKAATITLSAQAVPFTLTASADLPSLATLAVTGLDSTTTVALTAATTLTTVNVAGTVDSFTLSSASVTDLTTAGNLTDFSITSAANLVNLTLGHTYISGDTAATISVTGAAKLTSLDMSQVTKVKTVTVTGNAKLATIVGPSATVLPEAGAAISVTTGTNSLTGTYTNGTNPVAATETTPAVARIDPIIASDSVNSLLTWWNAAAANADAGVVTSTSIDIENISYDNAGTAAKGSLTVAIAANETASAGSAGAAAAPIADAATRAMVAAE